MARPVSAALPSRCLGAARALIVVAGLAVLTSAAGPSDTASSTAADAQAVGGIGLRLVEAPLSAGNDPRARLYIVDHLAPGTVIERLIEVSNTSATTAHIDLYPAAGSISAGSFLGADGHTPNDVSTWTTVSPPFHDVPVGGRQTATVRIAVPGDAAPGEQYGVVWAEVRSAPVAAGGVTRVSRVGIRMYLSVGPGGPPAADFTIDSLTAQRAPDGRPTILAMVHNTGGRALDMHGTLQLTDGPGGLRAGPIPATLGTTVAIGQSEPVAVTLDKRLPAGPWDAQIMLRSGLLERTASAIVSFPASGTSSAVPTRSFRYGWLYATVAAIVLLVAGTGLLVALRRRRLDAVRDRASSPVRAR